MTQNGQKMTQNDPNWKKMTNNYFGRWEIIMAGGKIILAGEKLF